MPSIVLLDTLFCALLGLVHLQEAQWEHPVYGFYKNLARELREMFQHAKAQPHHGSNLQLKEILKPIAIQISNANRGGMFANIVTAAQTHAAGGSPLLWRRGSNNDFADQPENVAVPQAEPAKLADVSD